MAQKSPNSLPLEAAFSAQAQPSSLAAPPATHNEHPLEVVLLLDPAVIDPGNGPNRCAGAMLDEGMEVLSLSILQARGNQQPIHVRKLLQPQGNYEYALISGARRLYACRLNGLPVRALVVDVTPEQALIERLVENHLREPLSPLELGMQLAHIKAQAGTDLSIRKLANLIGINASMVQKALDIAALPNPVVEAFASPKDIRYSDSKTLKDWVAAAPDAVVEAATQLKGQALPPKQVLECLSQAAKSTGGQMPSVESFNTTPLKVQGQVVGEIKVDKAGQLLMALSTPMSLLQQQMLAQSVEQFVARKVLRIKPEKYQAVVVEMPEQIAEVAHDKSVKTAANDRFGNEGAHA